MHGIDFKHLAKKVGSIHYFILIKLNRNILADLLHNTQRTEALQGCRGAKGYGEGEEEGQRVCEQVHEEV